MTPEIEYVYIYLLYGNNAGTDMRRKIKSRVEAYKNSPNLAATNKKMYKFFRTYANDYTHESDVKNIKHSADMNDEQKR